MFSAPHLALLLRCLERDAFQAFEALLPADRVLSDRLVALVRVARAVDVEHRTKEAVGVDRLFFAVREFA
jgi:hypothetical protein